MSRPSGHAEMTEAAAEMGVTLKSFQVLSYNAEPFTVGTPAHVRDAEWFYELWTRIGFPAGTHLRRIHYRILGEPVPEGGVYENNSTMWGRLLKAASYCRWLELIDPALLDDRRNPDPVVNARPRDEWDLQRLSVPDLEISDDDPEVAATSTSPDIAGYWSEPRVWSRGDPPEVSISATAPSSWGIEGPDFHGYDYDPTSDQPLVEVWAEKSTMNDILGPLCRQMGANYVSAAGTQSITNAHRLVERSKAAGRPVRVLYISDHDKQGKNMPFSVARHVEFMLAKLGDVAFRLTPILLTAKQVDQYELPPDPMRDNAVELDALEALHPGELARIVRGEIARLRDPSLRDRLDDTSDHADEIVSDAWQAATGHLVAEVDEVETRIRRLIDRYDGLGRTLNDRLQADVGRASDTHDAAAQEINDDIRAEIGDVLDRYRAQAGEINRQLRSEVAELAEGYEARVDALAARLRRQLNALVEQRSRLGERLAEAVDGFDVELPERPGPVLDDDPSDRWLFDSERHWLDQLAVYRQHRANGNGVMS